MVSFVQLLSDRDRLRNDLPMSGPAVELRFQPGKRALSLRAGKLFHLLVKCAGARLADDVEHTIRLAELRDLGHLRSDEIVEVVQELQQTLVELTVEMPPYPDGDQRLRAITGPILADVGRDLDRRGDLSFRFSKTMRSIMAETDYWAILSRRVVMAFESRYALRLYEILALRIGLERKASEVFELDDLRRRLGVPGNVLPEWADFRRTVLEKAIAEINHISGITVQYQPIKRGRAVATIKLTWSEKAATERRAAAKELERHRAGRKARRAGTVETIAETVNGSPRPPLAPAETFPASGSIRYTPWEDIARRSHPAPLPDLERLTGGFRQWCASRPKPIPLTASNIRKVFETWCAQGRPAK